MPRITPASAAAAACESFAGLDAWQRGFLAKIGHLGSVLALLEQVPCGVFFVKDKHSRIVWASHSCRSRLGARHLAAKQVAKDILRDDQKVLKTGQPILHRAEVWYNDSHSLDWIVTSKLPLFDRQGRTIGIVGFVESSSTDGQPGFSDPHVGRAVAFIEKHHHSPVKMAELASASALSQRQLLRAFRKQFGTSVREFVLKVRIQAASDALLQSHDTIAEVAASFGFCDQSSFTRQFRRIIGMTPMAYQRKYGRRGS